MKKTITIPAWLLVVIGIVAAFAVLYAIGVFDSNDIKAAESNKDTAKKIVDTLTNNRTTTIATASENSYKSTEIATELIKNLPDEKYNVIRDTSVDYMFRKITE